MRRTQIADRDSDVAVVLERERLGIGSKTTTNSKNFVATTLYDGGVLQEMKLEDVSERSGGVLCIWELICFSCSSMEIFENMIVLRGLWVHVDWSGGIMGIYAACGGAEQPAFCEKALMIISRTRCAWCVGGHFNAVLRSDKCRGCVLSTQVINVFNEFVEEAALVDIPL
ncbi:hypothetical protein V6N13_108552 [Hibiscus sabdariffa]